MGSGQSATVGNPDHSATASFPSIEKAKNDIDKKDASEVENKVKKKKKDKNSTDYKCRKQKRAWSRCVSVHYEKKFLPGKSLEPEEDCDDMFDKFRNCYLRGMIKQRQGNGMDPPKKDSMLHEFMVEEGMLEDDDE